MNSVSFTEKRIATITKYQYQGLEASGERSAVVILRAGAIFETGLKRVIPDCKTGRILIQSNAQTCEPELHYLKLPEDIATHSSVILLDPQMSSGGAALMSVQVLIDHGVQEQRIVLVTYSAGKMGLIRLTKVFPLVKIVACTLLAGEGSRWMDQKYFGC